MTSSLTNVSIFPILKDTEMPLYGSAYLNRAKAESQTAGHPVLRDEFGMTLPVKLIHHQTFQLFSFRKLVSW
jgi:hypothetical protein